MERLISFAVILQSLELMRIQPWDWEVMRVEIPSPLRPLIQLYSLWIWLRFFAAGLTLFFPIPSLFAFQILTTWWIALRWRGTFNGGSDCMTIQILLATLVNSCFPDQPLIQTACVFYVAVQAVLSYFIAGIAKLRQREWRSGRALAFFLQSRRPRLQWLSLAVLGFECLFPLSLVNPLLSGTFLAGGVVFHLSNFHYFGLNRFLFVWLATYPAILYTSWR